MKRNPLADVLEDGWLFVKLLTVAIWQQVRRLWEK